MMDKNNITTEEIGTETELKSKKDYSKYTLEFKEPYEYEGKKFEKIEFDFGKLEGWDYFNVESEMSQDGEFIITSPEINSGFLCRIASKASGIGTDVLKKMPIAHFTRIISAARRFFMNTD